MFWRVRRYLFVRVFSRFQLRPRFGGKSANHGDIIKPNSFLRHCLRATKANLCSKSLENAVYNSTLLIDGRFRTDIYASSATPWMSSLCHTIRSGLSCLKSRQRAWHMASLLCASFPMTATSTRCQWSTMQRRVPMSAIRSKSLSTSIRGTRKAVRVSFHHTALAYTACLTRMWMLSSRGTLFSAPRGSHSIQRLRKPASPNSCAGSTAVAGVILS